MWTSENVNLHPTPPSNLPELYSLITEKQLNGHHKSLLYHKLV